MSKYIDQDQIAELARHSTTGIDANDIMRFPSIEIIHCKDCKYFGYDYEYKHPCCTRIYVHPRVSDADYCSYAERRKQDE